MQQKINFITAIVLFLLFIPLMVLSQQPLLILAPDHFLDELYPLQRFKECSIRPTTLLGLNEVYNTFSGADEAEQIKNCIAHYEKTKGIGSVLLVGDIDQLPARWCWWGRWLPNDPYFRGIWSVVTGAYRQTEKHTAKPYCSWLNVGSNTDYTIEVVCRPIHSYSVQWETRIIYADADRAESRYRLDLRSQSLRLLVCGNVYTSNDPFTFNQTYGIKIHLSSNRVQVWVNNVLKQDQELGSVVPVGTGKIGFGSYFCESSFDNFKVTANNTTIWNEDFNDGVANGFTYAPTMNERNWAVSDLYYADLYKDGTSTFDDWNGNKNTNRHHEQLYGEIEFKIDQYNPYAVINNDHIDFLPDVAVVRMPASTEEEVSRYVNHVIAYETRSKKTDNWFKRVILLEGSIGGGAINDQIGTTFQNKGLSVINRHWANDLKNLTNDQRKTRVVNYFNQGAGFVNYLGHGNVGEWSCINFTHMQVKDQLTNTQQFPIVAAGACFTGKFAKIIPDDPYLDVNNTLRDGTVMACERFPGPPESSTYSVPKPLQTNYDVGYIA